MPEPTDPARAGAGAPHAPDRGGRGLEARGPAGHGPDAHDPERLRRLEERLAAARARRVPPPRADEHYSQANVAWRMVIELVAGIGIGLGMGLGLDALLGTRPLMMVVFTLLGFAAGVRVMLRTAQEIGGAAGGGGTDRSDLGAEAPGDAWGRRARPDAPRDDAPRIASGAGRGMATTGGARDGA